MFRFHTILICTALIFLCDSGVQRLRMDKECEENQIYILCGNQCSPYCKNDEIDATFDLPVCDSTCYAGCSCMVGFIRETSRSNSCIPINECSSIPPKCRKNEVYKYCDDECPRSCDNLDFIKCDKRCITGCACKEGYVRTYNDVDSDCIPESNCPSHHF